MLSEELILHYIPKVFKGYQVKEKSLLRVTRNADIDADALYDEDLDYREFMADLIKKRKKLAPVRIELSRKLSEGSEEILDSIRAGYVSYVINTRAILSGIHYEDGVAIRRCAIENNVTMFTSLDTVKVLLDVLEEQTIKVSTIF